MSDKTFREQLESMTIIVADTGDINAIKEYTPRDATTNPSLILSAAGMDEYQGIINGAVSWAKEHAEAGASKEETASLAVDRLAVAFGMEILKVVPGRVSTEVDARLSYDTDATIAKARKLIGFYEEEGISRDRILIKIASTWEGIKAAEVLEKEGIHCNLTLLFGLHQAVACAEAGITLISPFVGRIMDWYKKETGKESYAPAEDPGVLSVTEIYNYYKKFGHNTEIMGASFRNLGEVTELAGCDLLTIAPKFLEALEKQTGELPRKLTVEGAKASSLEKIKVTKETFVTMHKEDRMATDKLAEGIERFGADIVKAEQMVLGRL